MDFWLRFACSARFSELLPGDLVGGAAFLENLTYQVLSSFPLPTDVDEVKLSFSALENTYQIQIYVRCYVHLKEMPYDPETTRAEIECLISQALLQCFWEIQYLE
jgi:hypothetical protein